MQTALLRGDGDAKMESWANSSRTGLLLSRTILSGIKKKAEGIEFNKGGKLWATKKADSGEEIPSPLPFCMAVFVPLLSPPFYEKRKKR